MNASIAGYENQELTYRAKEVEEQILHPSRARRSKHLARRRAKTPTQYNGMHRRRRKRITW
jgi:hypothetical protein